MARINVVCLLGMIPLLTLANGQETSVMAAYFVEWGIYQRNYLVKDLEQSGSADKLTHLLYAFANVTEDGKCVIFDHYASVERYYSSSESVDGQASYGTFSQLLKLKNMHPGLKILYSVGGWTLSKSFGAAAQNPDAFAQSCFDLMYNSADVPSGLFDGIDIDWEYPNACGFTCDDSGEDAFNTLMTAVRAKFGSRLVTSAIGMNGLDGGVLDLSRFDKAKDVVDYFFLMGYDYNGPFPGSEQGPTALMAPVTSYPTEPIPGFNIDTALTKLIDEYQVPPSMMALGIPFYGRGWTGVTQATPGGSATGPAMGEYESGVEDYKVLLTRCPATGTEAGTAYAFCSPEWWSYDTVATTTSKMQYAKSKGLAGAFAWELSGDNNGEMVSAMVDGWALATAANMRQKPNMRQRRMRPSLKSCNSRSQAGRGKPIHRTRPPMGKCVM